MFALRRRVLLHDARRLLGWRESTGRAKLGFEPFRESLPIFIAGDRRGVLRLAGQVADGAILNAVGSEYLSTIATDRVLTAAQEVGRDPASVEITVGSTEAIREALLRFYQAGATRVLLASVPGTKESIRKLLRAMQPFIPDQRAGASP